MSAPTDLSRLRLGTAPDSWGVWFPEDPHQVTWQAYLDEIAAVGYVYTELGPQGFLPQDPAQLSDELDARGLTVCGGTVFADKDVVVTQPTAGDFKAFSATCTHQGCKVKSVADGVIVCPCHGSKFAIADGAVTAGPAKSPLPAKTISVEGDSILLA